MSHHLTLEAICDREPATVCASATLNEVAQLLSNYHRDAIVAIASPVQRPTAVGIVTYLEILHALASGSDLKHLRVIDVLSRNPLILHEEEDIETAILKLRRRGLNHAPVVGPAGTLCGAISMDRLMGCHLLEQFAGHSKMAIRESAYK